tara:strand:- start:408 stop:770 length:363 start_codon:yes stop_codon:yes gene_type:complete
MSSRECPLCMSVKSTDDFYARQTRCKSCQIKTVTTRRDITKKFIKEYKEEGECCVCSYSKKNNNTFTPKALHFHHTGDKRFGIGDATANGYSLSSIKKEIDVCILVCSRCHAEIHADDEV